RRQLFFEPDLLPRQLEAWIGLVGIKKNAVHNTSVLAIAPCTFFSDCVFDPERGKKLAKIIDKLLVLLAKLTLAALIYETIGVQQGAQQFHPLLNRRSQINFRNVLVFKSADCF